MVKRAKKHRIPMYTEMFDCLFLFVSCSNAGRT